jgi:hypothetical protein
MLIAVAAPLLISVCARPTALIAVAANTPASEAESIASEVPALDESSFADYSANTHKCLDGKLSAKYRKTQDWALTSFTIKQDGTIAKAWPSNSTGNDKFNSHVLKILHATKLADLPEDAPNTVKAYHAFGYTRGEKIQKPSPERLDNQQTSSADDTRMGAKIMNHLVENGLVSRETNLANLEALINIVCHLAEIIWYIFLFGIIAGGLFGPTLLFFIAGPYWLLHRLLLGRIPS